MKTCLYITYDGLLDPLGQAQILPYIESLNKKGYKFIILSYEKVKNKNKILGLKKNLKEKNILWKTITFRKSKINFLYRIFVGALFINYIKLKSKIDLVHLRGGYSSLIYLFSFSKINYIYDLRAFWGQWAEGGRTLKNSLTYKILLKLEKTMIDNAEAIVVLDKSGKNFINKNFFFNKTLEVISTSTNVEKYKIKTKAENFSCIKFVYLGGVSYPPYRIKDALIFLNFLNKLGFECEIDFINKSEHKIIADCLEKEKTNNIKINIISLNHDEIFEILPNYHIGFLFLQKGEWLKMSCPTKIGEYLAAGLGIIGNKGIAVLDRLSKESNCVETIDIEKGKLCADNEKIMRLLTKINSISFKKECQKLAKKHFSLKKANDKYLSIYGKITNK